MRDIQEVLQELVEGDDILWQVLQHYMLERPDNMFDIQICRVAAGRGAGSIFAIPKMLWRAASKIYCGRGGTEEEALLDCLRKVRGVPHKTLFPVGPNDEEEVP